MTVVVRRVTIGMVGGIANPDVLPFLAAFGFKIILTFEQTNLLIVLKQSLAKLRAAFGFFHDGY